MGTLTLTLSSGFRTWLTKPTEEGAGAARGKAHALRPDGNATCCGRTVTRDADYVSDTEPPHRVCHACLRILMRPYL